jgi:peptidoglycan hydrolase CwlO-like protein
MKRTISIGLAAMLVFAFATGVMAFGPGHGFRAEHALTPEQAQKVEQFQKDIAPLREQISSLRGEIFTLRAQASPDWEMITAKQKEIVEIKTAIQKKAVDAGVAGLGAGYGKKRLGRMTGL